MQNNGVKYPFSSDSLLLAGFEGAMEFDLNIEHDLGKPIAPLAHEEMVALDYDWRDDRMYWISYKDDAIKSAFTNGSG